MQISLGFIETDTIFGAIEASNVMVKTSNVILAGKEVFSSGVITIKIIGENEAVKTAVEAGAEAIKKLGRKVSSHIIIDPDEQLLSILPEFSNFYFQLNRVPGKVIKENIKTRPKIEKEIVLDNTKESDKTESKEVIRIKKPAKNIIKEADKKRNESKINYKNDTIERLRKEALGLDKAEKKKEIKKEIKEKKEEHYNPELESLNVHQLRRLARGTTNFPIQGREISRANREVLLKYFMSSK